MTLDHNDSFVTEAADSFLFHDELESICWNQSRVRSAVLTLNMQVSVVHYYDKLAIISIILC